MKKIAIGGLLLALSLLLYSCGSNEEGKNTPEGVDTRLSDAIASDNLEGVKEALADGADINSSYVKYPEPQEVNPLEYASERLNRRIPRYLLDNGANLDFRIKEGSTPLSSAAYRNDVDSCKTYLSYGADIEYTTREGETPLDRAALTGAEDAIKLLLENGAVVTQGTLDRVLKGEYGDGYIHYGSVRLIVEALVSKHEEVPMEDIVFAAVTGDSERVISLGSEGKLNEKNLFLVGNNVAAFGNSETLEFCIQKGFSLVRNNQYNEYEEPLEVAARYGNLENVKWMLDHWEEYGKGSDPKYVAISEAVVSRQHELVSYLLSLGTYLRLDNDGRTLDNAVDNEDAEMIALILESKPVIADNRLAIAISNSILNNDYDSAKLLLQAGGDLSEECKRQMWSFASESLDILKLCAEYDELPTDGYLWSRACESGNYAVAKYLIENGVDVNSDVKSIGPPIENAVKHGFIDIVKLLVENGADVNYVSDTYGSMLMLASKNSANITQYLIDNSADINYQYEGDGRENTALMDAVLWENIRCVKVLLNAGADTSIQNAEGLTAADLAMQTNNQGLMDLFK